ncbi:MAG TPA: glycosyltransferase family A protein, partial [Afifellaceae bacterium]|nr:glycosyltransferase family A protein [Afifellaceae bacterium]
MKGRLERIERGSVIGWIYDPSAPDAHLELEVRIDGTPVVTGTADRARGDLARSGIGNGAHGFAIEVPASFRDGRPHRVQAFERATGWQLPGPTGEMVLERSAAAGTPAKPVRFVGGRPLSAFIQPIAAEAAEASAEERDGDAIANGRFTRWSAPFRQTLSRQAVPLADGWFLEGKKPNLKLAAWLTEVITRDLQAGDEGALGYGISIFGDLPGRYARLVTALDPEKLTDGRRKRLRFFARPASAMQLHPSLIAPPPAVIANISIVERTFAEEEDKATASRRVLVLAKKLKVPPPGKIITIDLSEQQLRSLPPRSDAAAGNTALLLVFEFQTFADCVIAEVSLTDAPEQEARVQDFSDRLSLEDENIAAQIGVIRGVEHWLSPDILPVPAPRHGGRAATLAGTAKWRWPSQPGRSVEIVICVHDAAEETLDCLDSVKRCTAIPHLVTIVDDGSTGSTR